MMRKNYGPRKQDEGEPESLEKAQTRIRASALRRLATREYSVKELVAYLVRKGNSAEISQEVVEKLLEDGWINEERFARALVGQLLARGKGPRAIRMKLKEKGIDPKRLGDLLEELGGGDELARAREIVERRYPRAATDRKIAARAFRALISRGFDSSVARRAVLEPRDTSSEA